MNMSEMTTDQLIMLRDRASEAYYSVGAESVMEDSEFDSLINELESRGVAELPAHGFIPSGEKVYHDYPMQSLKKVHSLQDIQKWLGMYQGKSVEIQPKFDGLALSLIYEDSKLHQAVTRGDHTKGENMTVVAHEMAKAGIIPSTISTDARTHVRGEVLIRKSVFKDLDGYSSIRNAASGILRRGGDQVKNLLFVAYETDKQTSQEVMSMRSWGFVTPDEFYQRTADTADDINESVMEFNDIRSSLDVETDGAVIKLDIPTSERESIGRTNTAPLWAVAYKYEDESVTAEVEDIIWVPGRTKKLTPVVIFSPVELDGGAITRKATLSSLARFKELQLRPGDHIKVVRSNGVIPYVVGLDEEFDRPNLPPYSVPETWDGVELNSSGKELKFVGDWDANSAVFIMNSVSSLEMKGIGKSAVEKMVSYSGVNDIIDLMSMDRTEVAISLGYSSPKKSSDNVYNALQSAKTMPLEAWIQAMGIMNVGKTKSRELAKKFRSLDALAEANIGDIVELDGFGETVAKNIEDFSGQIQSWSDRLGDMGVKPTTNLQDSVTTSDSSWLGKKVAVTGSFDGMNRKLVEDLVRSLGGIVSSTVTKNTDVLVAGDNAGSKLTKAQGFGIMVVGQDEFLMMV